MKLVIKAPSRLVRRDVIILCGDARETLEGEALAAAERGWTRAVRRVERGERFISVEFWPQDGSKRREQASHYDPACRFWTLA